MIEQQGLTNQKIKISESKIAIILLIVIFLSFGYLFGFLGIRLLLGFFFALILPTYIIIRLLPIDKGETVIFSVFLGLIITPLFIWYVDRIFQSLQLSIIISAIILYVVGFYLTFKRRKK